MSFVNRFWLSGPNAPLGSSDANNLDGYILDSTKLALNERYNLEHQDLDGASDDSGDKNAQGRHKPGYVGVLFYGLKADLPTTGMGEGSIAYTSDEGNFYRYVFGTGWNILAINADTIFADEESLTYDVNTLKMKRDNQQWTSTITLTDAASISTPCDYVDESNPGSNSFEVTLGGDRLLADPTGMKEGATYVWIVKQDATGSWKLTYGDAFLWAGGIPAVLSLDPGAVDIITAICLNEGTDLVKDHKLYCSVLYDFA